VTRSEALPHDCGHRCCNERGYPDHSHFLAPVDCPPCRSVGEKIEHDDNIRRNERRRFEAVLDAIEADADALVCAGLGESADFKIVKGVLDNVRRRLADVESTR
jgi:hypothetical protein